MAISSSKDFIVFPNDNSSRVTIKEATFAANGTWTAPTGVTSAQVILVGAGGGGGGGSDIGAGGGGGGGAVVVKNVDVSPGTSYAINIGAGGQGGQGAIASASDYTNTLPGGNGGTTTFGNITIANYLTNSNFDYSFAQWDADVIFRYATGAASASSIIVFPNANGITAGQLVSGTNLGTNTQVVSVSGNVVTLSVANTSTAVNAVVRFDQGTANVKQGSIFYNNVSNGTYLSNAMGLNSVSSPNTQNLSNNLLQPQVAQLEDATTLSSNYIRVYGTNAATLSITNAGIPTKLAEMQVPFTRTVTAAQSSSTLTVSDTTNLQVGMFVIGSGIGTGAVILSIDSLTQVTVSTPTTNVLSAQSVTFSYTGTFGLNALQATTGSAISTGNPTWLNWSNLNNTSSVTASTTNNGFAGIPYQPGQTYSLSVYVSANLAVSSSTPILFQLRSTSVSSGGYMAQSNTSYTTGNTSTGTTSSIDAGTANGFFVRQITPTPMVGFGGSVTVNGTAANTATTVTVTDASQLLIGMSVTGTGMASGALITGVSGNVLTLSLATTAAITAVPLTFATPTGTQILGSNQTVGQTGWRRISGTFTTPSFSASTANGVYGYGSWGQLIYPTIVLQQASTVFWFDNMQLEVGGSVTAYQQPLYAYDNVLVLQTNSTAGSDLEVGHRFVKSIAGNTYTGTLFAVAGGTAQQYRPVQAFLEYFDKDYNSLGRSLGLSNVLPITTVASTTAQMPQSSYPVRIGVSAQAPTGTAWMRLGATAYQAAQSATGTTMEFYLMYPQLELAATSTVLKRANDGTYTYAGQPGMSPIVTSATVAAEGGGGGGTYNTSVSAWLYGLEGANNGGHAAGASGTLGTLPTLAGGGGGAGGIGGNGIMYMPTNSATTSFTYGSGWNSTAGSSFQTFPMRGNAGGYAMWNTSTTGSSTNAYMPSAAGDGGPGVIPSGLNSGSAYGIPLAGGGGGAGWTSTTQFATVPGRGNAGGGKGGGTWLVAYNSTQAAGVVDYYSRGIDGVVNTGGGGGGGGANLGNTPQTTRQHVSAGTAVAYDTITSDAYKWTGLYNAQAIQQSSPANIAGGTYGLQVTIQDVGNAKVVTAWQAFPILPRTALIFPIVGARLQTAPTGVTSNNFSGLPKRVRPTVRWKNYQGVIIREDRPTYDIQFSAITTNNYIAGTASGNTAGSTVPSGWQTVPAPDNAAYFDVCWEFLYFDAGDVVYVDISDCQYYAYQPYGGNGGDGLAIVRYFDKAVV